MKLCALNREELDRLFASMSSTKLPTNDLNASFSSLSLAKDTTHGLASSRHASTPTPSNNDTKPPRTTPHQPSIDELATVLTALRKLREAITASSRTDAFARRAYYFSIHVAILCRDWESYVPALHSLLNKIHTVSPLPAHDLRDYIGLLILDQVCRQSDFAGARETKQQYGYSDRRVESVMKALVADDWVSFWRMRRSVDGYQRSVMEWADAKMRVHALKCLGKSYMVVERRFLERVTERSWGELVDDGVGWELDAADRVVIRKPKGG
jgi:hypothetical protein